MSRRATPAEIRREWERRRAADRREWDPIVALEGNPQQIPIFYDKTRNRIVTGTRQGGKTRFALTDVIDAHLASKEDGGESAYVDMDKEHGGKVAWNELALMLKLFRIPARIVDDYLRFDNGSRLYIFSGKPSELTKLQGLKYIRLIVDECQELQKLQALLTYAGPALMRHNGRIILMGIPGRVSGLGEWWHACEGKNARLYGQHRIDFWHNPYLSEEAKVEMFETEKARLGVTHPDFLRHWLGKWPAVNMATRVYHYDSDKNGYDEGDEPECELHALGLDPGGVRDEEAAVVLGHGNADGKVWHLDEDGQHAEYNDEDELQEVDWDASGDMIGPMQAKWNCSKRFYDYGSAHKGALTLIYQKDKQILMDAVPSKDPYEESKRINELFRAKLLYVKRGSRLEADLLYTEWDVESLKNGGKPKYARTWKQNFADALRCAMWAVFGVVQRKRKHVPKDDIEREALRVASGEAYKRGRTENRTDKYTLPAGNPKFPVNPTVRKSPQPNVNGRINRGY